MDLKYIDPQSRVLNYCIEHIELPAKLLDHFLRSNKSNINQLKVMKAIIIICPVEILLCMFCLIGTRVVFRISGTDLFLLFLDLF